MPPQDRQGDVTITRVAACTVRGCPAPRDPDWHRCFVCKSDTIEHHHVQPRGMGGSKVRSGPENVVALCHREHEAVTTHECSDRILDLPGKGRTYVYYDVRGKVLCERVLEAGSAAAEAEVAKLQGSRVTGEKSLACGSGSHNRGAGESAVNSLRGESRASSSAAASPASGEGEEVMPNGRRSRIGLPMQTLSRTDYDQRVVEGEEAGRESRAAEPPVRGALPGPAGDSRLVPSPSAAPPSVFDLSSWCQQGMSLVYFGLSLKDSTDTWRFALGDWFNEGETILSDEAYGYLRPFKDETVRQYAWVAGTVGHDTRVLELSWSFHRAVAALPAPKQKEWLDKARDENLTTRQLHQAIHGKKPKVKRWTWQELEGHLCQPCREALSLMEAK